MFLVFYTNSAQLSSTRNFFIIFNRAFIIFNRPFAHSFVYSICGNKGCACYSRAVLREWAQHSCLCLVLCSEVWILCSQYECLLLGFDVQVQLCLAQCRKSLVGQEVEQKSKETSLCKLRVAFVNISKSCVNDCVLLSELQKAFPSIKYLRLLLPICHQMENPV